MRMGRFTHHGIAIAGLIALLLPCAAQAKTKFKDPEQSRAEYIARIENQSNSQIASLTPGSLWQPGGALTAMTADYKARSVGDTVMIQVLQQTTAQSTADASAQRTFQTSSAITALPGRIKTGGVDPLLGANSATQLKGQGSASNTSKLLTAISGSVIAVLPNGNLVVEAEREILMNNQHETMFIRGVLRPGDVSPFNTAPSTALANLEIELKGKGVVSDATRRPNFVTRVLLWLTGF
jgi:flagellar L-ring protein precursor FlgH